MSTRIKWLIVALLAATSLSVIAVVFMVARRPDTGDEDEEEAVKTSSQVVVENGQTVIRLSEQAQEREGIGVAALQPTSRRADLRATAVLMPAGDLAGLRNSYVAARTKLRRDQLDLKVAGTQFERIHTLYQQNQNMSLKAMQDAEAAYRTSQAQVEADQQDAELQLDAVRQRWGLQVARWIAGNSPLLASVLRQGAFLAQVSFPPGEIHQPPATLSLTTPGNRLTPARLVGPMPEVNSQIQGVSFLYLAPGKSGMAVGMNLLALVPVGPVLHGSLVPQSAVVWWQGKAWAYQETTENKFTRHEVPTENPLSQGYFVPGAVFAPGTKLVITGAQALLSQEFRNQIQQED